MSAEPDDSWKARARAELDELTTRTEELAAFLTGPQFKTVDIRSQVDIQHQLTAMQDYGYYLARRLNRAGA